jgi:chitinase
MWTLSKLLCTFVLVSFAPASSAVAPHQAREYNYPLSRNSTDLRFDPLSRNLAVYYGKAQYTASPSLYELCANSDVDIVVMGFVRQLNGPSALPQFGFTKYCKSPTTITEQSRVSCPDMAANITFCQSMGKKVLVSLGGSTSNLTFNSVGDARQAASILWNVFGEGTNSTALRPFGHVAIDGFDFGKILHSQRHNSEAKESLTNSSPDLESGADTSYMDILASSLQSYFKTTSLERYISAAPLCANNTVLPYGFYANANFVWPRFYNAKACCFGSKGFKNSVTSWYNFLGSVVSDLGSAYPRIYLGGLSFNNSNSGFVQPDAFVNATFVARNIIQAEFGGVSLWEGTDGLITKNAEGRSFLSVSKASLLRDL